MAYHTVYPFKLRTLESTAYSSSAKACVVVPARGKLVSVTCAPQVAQTAAAGAFDVWQNGTTVVFAVAMSSGSVGVAAATGLATANIYLAKGDVLATDPSSIVAATYSFVIQEF